MVERWLTRLVERFEQALNRDPLGVLGSCSAVAAFLLWALPINCWGRGCYVNLSPPWGDDGEWFTIANDFGLNDEAQAIAALFALAVILLLLRRR